MLPFREADLKLPLTYLKIELQISTKTFVILNMLQYILNTLFDSFYTFLWNKRDKPLESTIKISMSPLFFL